MTPDQLSRIREEITREGVMICFNGTFVHSIIEELGNALRRYLQEQEEQKSAALDVFSVYIEQAQNIRNYLARKKFTDATSASAIIVIARRGERYVVSSGNVVDGEDQAALTAQLEQVRSADAAELRKLFKEKLRSGTRDPAGGAGMGLIEVARRCAEPLQYAFHPVEGGRSFFCLTAVI
ncbi:MAG TPA: SiaB family protein kinase [Spirochaetia bacterium]|nr:SiaB family protein kinase [Spirochaetia bacterium]